MPRCGCASQCLCSVVGSGCVTVGGAGSAAVPYTVGLTIDPVAGNALSCGEDGLFASAGTGGTTASAILLDFGSTPTVLPPALIGAPSRAQWLADTVGGATNTTVFAAGTGVLPQAYVECNPGFDGVYAAQVIMSGWTAGPAAAGDVIFRVGFGLSSALGAAAMWGTPVYSSAAAAYNTPAVGGVILFPFNAGDQVWVEVGVEDYSGAFAGATLAPGPVYDTQPTSGLAMVVYRLGDAP